MGYLINIWREGEGRGREGRRERRGEETLALDFLSALTPVGFRFAFLRFQMGIRVFTFLSAA